MKHTEKGIAMKISVESRSLAVAMLLASAAASKCQTPPQGTPSVIHVEGDVDGVHDPSIIKEADTWYLFGTVTETISPGQLPIRCSKDLHTWKRCGFVFRSIPDWIKKESPQTKDLWAPDESYFDGKYHVYYAFSVFGKNTSGIALVTNKTLNPSSPDFKWVDEGLVFRSREEDDFNAIDPNIVADSEDHLDELRQLLERHQDAANQSPNRQACRRGLQTLFNSEAGTPGKSGASPAQFTRRLASHRSSVHPASRELLLSLRFVRSVLPRREKQLQNDGRPLTQCYRAVRGRCRQANAGRQGNATACRQSTLGGPRR